MSHQEKHRTTAMVTPVAISSSTSTSNLKRTQANEAPSAGAAAASSSSGKQQQVAAGSKAAQNEPIKLKMSQSQSQLAKTQTKLVANLHSAASEGKFELVRLLLRCGADVNAQDDEFGNTALHQAAWNGFSQTVQVLCKYRANTSIRNKAQFTPLHMACQQGHNQTVRLLLMANAKTEAKNSYGDTPLHTAARYGHAGAARILLSAKCNPNLVNKNHDTPLHIAAAMGRRKLTKIFMQNGAEPAVKNKQDETAMDIALRKDLIDIQELIANPPPAKPSRSSRATAADEHAHQLGQLEQRYGALYAGAGRSNKAVAAVPKCSADGHQRKRHSSHHHLMAVQSSEDNCSSSRQLGQQMSRLNLNRHRHQHKQEVADRGARHLGIKGELAVDVPEADKFASAHSLAAGNHRAQCRAGAQHRHLRTKTISGAGAELRLLAGAASRRSEVTSGHKRQLQTTASAADLNACLPDARPDKSSKWADIMAKSGRFQASGDNSSPLAASPVIEMEFDEDEDDEASTNGLNRNRHTKSASPGGGSLRSSLSKSRGRLLVVRRNRKLGSNKLLVRRSNLGTCVGKLSLLRLRTMVSRHRAGREEDEDAQVEDEEANRRDNNHEDNSNANGDDREKCQRDNQSSLAMAEDSNAIQSLPENAAGEMDNKENKVLPLVRFGRRQERLEQLRDDGSSKGLMVKAPAPRAPNGNKLQATRPLAPLNDDTLLYAIPKKKQVKQQVAAPTVNSLTKGSCQELQRHNEIVVVVAKNSGNQHDNGNGHDNDAASKADPPARPDRVPSGGPALTSDGCQSSSSDGHSSSSFARASPPSSSSAIASSSDECIESMDLICVNKQQPRNNNPENCGAQTNARDQQRPAVVGVHHGVATSTADDLDLYAPGYSIIREAPQQQQQKLTERADQRPANNNGAGEPYLCNDQPAGHESRRSGSEPAQTKPAPSPTKQQQPATKPGSRLRQLLHLEPRTKTNGASVDQFKGTGQAETASTKTAIGNNKANGARQANTGHYAYSPVAQSSSSELLVNGDHSDAASHGRLVASEQQATTTKSQASGPKRSWLMSRFSLSSNNLTTNPPATNASSNETQCVVGKDHSTRVENLQPVNRRPCQADASPDSGRADSGAPRDSEKTDTAVNETEPTEGYEEANLIRPKSAISGRNLELIEAQKSLAAAAAAKVKRDRLFKMSGCDGSQQLEIVANITNQHGHLGENGTPLTVKTSEPPFWAAATHPHHHSGGLVLANGSGGQKYLIGQSGQNHRSGTNSVGMSDSSPSNNGAESDNSIQTTSGSMNTDNASGGQLSTSESNHQNSSPLGILSRILLNSKSAGAIRQVANSVQQNGHHHHHQAPGRDSMNSSGSTLRNGQSGGSLSSSALSSPASNDRQSSSPGAPAEQAACQKLDQLGSRSRCPIVLARSNELVEDHHQATREPAPAPRLPAKSALKPPGARQQQQQPPPPTSGLQSVPVEPMNGLPRVASYTQISTIDPTSGIGGGGGRHYQATLDDFSRQQSLCNYHAMNRQHQIQAQYSPYLPYALGRYSIYGPCEPLAQPNTRGKYGPPMHHPHPHHHHLSHHDLRSLDTNQAIDLTLPASAINYEYYLETPIHHHHHNQQQQQPVPHFTGATATTGSYPPTHLNSSRYHQSYSTNTGANDNSIYPTGGGGGFGHDESIYIPYHLNGSGVRVRDTILNGPSGGISSTRPATAMASTIPASDLIPNTGGGGGGGDQQHLQVFNRGNTTNNHHHLHDLHRHNLVDQSALIHRRRPPLPPPQHLQQRPKSSLDTFLLPGAGSAPLPPLPKPNGVAVKGPQRQQVPPNGDATNTQSAAPAHSNRISLATSDTTVVVGGGGARDYPPVQSNNPPYSYALSSPYHPSNGGGGGGYIYSENSIYASDQSAAVALQHSDLTVLPTDATSADATPTTDRPTSSCYRQSPSLSSSSSSAPPSAPATATGKVACTEGGNAGGGCNESSNGTSSVQVNSSSTLASASPGQPPSKANTRHQLDKSSWTPSTPFRSLVQVKHSSSAKSNQSSLSKLEGTLSSASMATIQSISADDDSDLEGDNDVDGGHHNNKSDLNGTIRMNNARAEGGGRRIIISTSAARQSQISSKIKDSIDNEPSSEVDGTTNNDEDAEESEGFDGSTML